MDLKLGADQATAEERQAVDSLLGEPQSSWRGADRLPGDRHVAHGAGNRVHRHELLPALHVVNDRIGWISPGAVNYLATRLDIAPAEIYGVATFYGLFSTTERIGPQLHVCVDLACQIAGVTGADAHRAGGHESPCLGLCERAPAQMLVTPGPQPQMTVTPDPPVVAAIPQAGDASLVLLARIGVVDPESLESYRAHGGYAALTKAVEMGAAGVVEQVTASGLAGRGGAAFPAGRKWATVAGQAVATHHLVCNADESEPGTFKDRVIMEGDPFALIEAITIAAFATGCQHGWVYLRGEYPLARKRLTNAIVQARSAGLLGSDIVGSGFDFDLEVFVGAGAYICGEETAIFNSIEGFRGEPRNKPPFPVEVGLFGKPTLVNNVETLVNVLPIVLGGGAAYAGIGSATSTGTKLFCLSGAVVRPGVYEVPFGVTLRQLIDLAGGVTPGRSLRAVMLGGAAGAFATPDELDVELTFEGTRAAGLSLGSGVVMVLDETVDLVAFVRRIAAFFRDESCGQCVPCRVGTVRQEEVLVRLESGRSLEGDRRLLADIGQVMRDASICGLGQTAYNAIESALAKLGVLA
ncbi:MAG: NADH-quinone oxidoreductase subunit [Ilumatobacteraceae bacterium]|nr:NADH-quinone oxidoreductase subunit [Ilumatobacteraceae bacterium]